LVEREGNMTDELARARAWNEANPDRVRAIRAKYRAAHPEVARKHYRKNRNRVIARVRAERAANPWKRRAYKAAAEAVRRDVLCECCTLEQLASVYDAAPPGARVVHVRWLSSGGKHCVSNLRTHPPRRTRDPNADLFT
jgi:hypothetical protein